MSSGFGRLIEETNIEVQGHQISQDLRCQDPGVNESAQKCLKQNELLFFSIYLTISKRNRLRVRKAEQKVSDKRTEKLNSVNDSTTVLGK